MPGRPTMRLTRDPSPGAPDPSRRPPSCGSPAQGPGTTTVHRGARETQPTPFSCIPSIYPSTTLATIRHGPLFPGDRLHAPDQRGVGPPRPGPLSAVPAVDVGGERADERQVPVLLRVVEPVPDDELVRDVESHVLHVEVHLDRLRLAQQRADLQ